MRCECNQIEEEEEEKVIFVRSAVAVDRSVAKRRRRRKKKTKNLASGEQLQPSVEAMRWKIEATGGDKMN